MKANRFAPALAVSALVAAYAFIQYYRPAPTAEPAAPSSGATASRPGEWATVPAEPGRVEQTTPTPGSKTPAAPAGRPDVGFRSRALLEDHFAKHGGEFGRITMAQYLSRAQALRDGPVGGAVLELRRDDGVATRFNRQTGEFLAFNRDLTIRTFFKPNDGEAYFRRQAEREGRP
jgi:hypothetical protein